jgi:hypothetical protein
MAPSNVTVWQQLYKQWNIYVLLKAIRAIAWQIIYYLYNWFWSIKPINTLCNVSYARNNYCKNFETKENFQWSGPFLTYKCPPPPCAPPPARNHILPPRKSPFFLNLYKQVSEEKEIDKQKVSFTLYPLSFRFNKIDLNCYVFLPLTNDKQFYFCAVFSFFYFKYKYS